MGCGATKPQPEELQLKKCDKGVWNEQNKWHENKNGGKKKSKSRSGPGIEVLITIRDRARMPPYYKT
ncbi:uncharacterized [Tachysurus ichikawai]